MRGPPAVRHSCATLNPDQSNARSRERAQRPCAFFLTLTYMEVGKPEKCAGIRWDVSTACPIALLNRFVQGPDSALPAGASPGCPQTSVFDVTFVGSVRAQQNPSCSWWPCPRIQPIVFAPAFPDQPLNCEPAREFPVLPGGQAAAESAAPEAGRALIA